MQFDESQYFRIDSLFEDKSYMDGDYVKDFYEFQSKVFTKQIERLKNSLINKSYAKNQMLHESQRLQEQKLSLQNQ